MVDHHYDVSLLCSQGDSYPVWTRNGFLGLLIFCLFNRIQSNVPHFVRVKGLRGVLRIFTRLSLAGMFLNSQSHSPTTPFVFIFRLSTSTGDPVPTELSSVVPSYGYGVQVDSKMGKLVTTTSYLLSTYSQRLERRFDRIEQKSNRTRFDLNLVRSPSVLLLPSPLLSFS